MAKIKATAPGRMKRRRMPGYLQNGSYQWFDLNKSGNENKGWDYKGSIAAGVTGALAPGREIWQNAGIIIGI